ncbi:MAG: hypothetical protein IJN84_04205, partial [Clostridia bacterium]|nr:hypothetical protein [Clostridia bacterium]
GAEKSQAYRRIGFAPIYFTYANTAAERGLFLFGVEDNYRMVTTPPPRVAVPLPSQGEARVSRLYII